jgi:hypothetical protein
MFELHDNKYKIVYDPVTAQVRCEGSLLLNGASAYEPILQLLKQAAEAHEPKKLIVDICALKFVNSSGINMLTKFVIYVSDIKQLKLTLIFQAQRQVAWQDKLCVNLQRLLPTLQVHLLS